MSTASISSRLSRWTQALALLLIAAMGLQGVPLQTLIHMQQHHRECTHPKGVCPMNPDGPCTCDHNDPSSPDKPVLNSCSDEGPALFRATGQMKWIPVPEMIPPAPRSSGLHLSSYCPGLSSQCMGNDLFRPPWSTADRPAGPLQAAVSA